ncbi:uncharacterized protein N7496_004909 [Penicillium cataractarum]|uniref:Calcineurin-like phosphoesterase domain-containing protein n=1 Tax=Penicillium cataractarum TaxID=2100454 RepID=A0A9W9VFE6_9EURO|nr:uncharacterized protein N7496_004909 [Penicillium cataractarum]KAJ5377500.1 hypothetical protein N7496_004909 [Penicillium cataractarum]
MADRQRPVKTRFFVISDTHGLETLAKDTTPDHQVDVVIHSGDLTTESKLEEYKASIRLLHTINAPLEIAIAGNHDFTMDIPAFQRKVADVKPPLDPTLVQQTYGYKGEARNYLTEELELLSLTKGLTNFD